ncbi:MAG: Calx-beta domain-containing protein, partial [Halothece sp.]
MKLQWSEELGTIVEEQNLLSEAVQPTNQLLTEFTQNNPFFSQLKTAIVEESNLTETNTGDDGENSLVAPLNRSKGEDTVNFGDSREDNVQLTSALPAETAQANEVALNISDFQFIERDSGKSTDFIFAANLDKAPSQPVTVDFQTVDGTATAGEDYIATSGTLTFEAGLEGLLVETIEVEVLGDNIDESNETFRVELSNPSSGLTLNNTTVTGAILDDEGNFQPFQEDQSEGPVTSQGNQALKADEARSNFNVDGSGITVGVLSDSYNNLNGAAEGVANGDLPGPENPVNTTPV